MRGRKSSLAESARTLPILNWPDADRRAWDDICRPGSRLKLGGAASHLAEVTREGIAEQYGEFLTFLFRTGRLDERQTAAASHVTPSNVAAYLTTIKARVGSVTVYMYLQRLHRAAALLDPKRDLSWLAEIGRELAWVMVPKSKFERLVYTGRLVEAGLTLITEAQQFAISDLARARGVRNGLMIALLALCPIRLKNFATLEIGSTFKEISGSWWIALPSATTKSRRPDERRVPEFLNCHIDVYLKQSRPTLLRAKCMTNALWISMDRGPIGIAHVGHLISQVTLQTIGVAVSPHLFRTAAASTAAVYGGSTPHLASALLNHTDQRVTEQHYIRASSMSASKIYAEITDSFLRD